jgi:3,4-dihydroxy-2-butanone 4-phosphate synthase
MSLPTRNTQAERTPPSPFKFDTIEDATRAIANGEFVVVMDDESRENEGDLICAAEKVTTEGMAWMIKWTRYFPSISTHVQADNQVVSFALQYPLNA